MYVQTNFDYTTVITQCPYSLPTLLSKQRLTGRADYHFEDGYY